MEKQAGILIREPVLAGVILETRQQPGTIARGAVGKVIIRGDNFATSLPGNHLGIHYVAVGTSKLAFFAMRQGLFQPSIHKLLAVYDRNMVQAVEIYEGVIPEVHFILRNGIHYTMLCPRMHHLDNLKKVQDLLVETV